ncbi:CHRD domain-containing protein [Hyaloraphidium curvatum]|nr:CHRD domain-containing protein [Hyaloraphidium curvatum]
MCRTTVFATVGLLLVLLAASASAHTVVWYVPLLGSSQVPPVTTTSIGASYVIVDDIENTVKVMLDLSMAAGANVTAAHLHDGTADTNGPILLTIVGSPTTETALEANFSSVAPQTIRRINNAQAYVNVQTAANPNGEIRGQLSRTTSLSTGGDRYKNAYVATLSGSSQVPPVATTSAGYAYMTYNETTGNITALVTTNIASITASHIQEGKANETGPVLVTLSGAVTGGVINAVVPATNATMEEVKEEHAYVNVQTAANPNGEIRGTLKPIAEVVGIGAGGDDDHHDHDHGSSKTTVTATGTAMMTTSRPSSAERKNSQAIAAIGAAAALAISLMA